MEARFKIFITTLLILTLSRTVKVIKRSGISDFERRLDVTEEDPTAMMDSADNGILISGHRKSCHETPKSGQSSQSTQEETRARTHFYSRNSEIPYHPEKESGEQTEGNCSSRG